MNSSWISGWAARAHSVFQRGGKDLMKGARR